MATEKLVEEPERSSAQAPCDAARTRPPGEVATGTGNLGMLLDLDLRVTVELGRARLKIRDVLNLTAGSVVVLDRRTKEPVDILVNGALLASGEVVAADDHFAVRITKLLHRSERPQKLV